ncbi:sodium/glutamate symporter [Variovorax sp. GT1P44]|uniref:sodium/glutamate symporter n=1 Tax=Variovorax sp. GT1P44 TaxID=3443742 RepID=UPI003F469AC8
MDIGLGVPATLAIAALVLVVGRLLIQRIAFLRKYSIPEPVVGGLVAAVLVAALHAAGVRIAFDTALQPGLMLAFFATIGLGADARMIAKGGGPLLRFTVCVIGMLLVENLIGVGAAKVMGTDPLIGLIAGSITMAGGHGTGAAWGQRFADQFGLAGAPALALASATFGLIMGGVIGGPVAMRLIRRLQARGEPLGVSNEQALAHDEAESLEAFTAERLIVTIMLVATSVAVGTALARWTENPVFTLPTFVWALFVGAVLRNALAFARVHEIDGQALSFTGAVSLSLFLAMALMSLRLWELASLALPMFVILALQGIGVALYTTYVTYRVMGANYEAAVLVAGQCGFGLGATPTAIANIQAICTRYGAAPQAFILVPVVGAFIIDLCNALVISGFVQVVAALR